MTDQPQPPVPPPNLDQPQPSNIVDIGDPFKVRSLAAENTRKLTPVGSGRRSRAVDTPRGMVIGARRPQQRLTSLSDVALIPTLQAAAERNAGVGDKTLPLAVRANDMRRKVRSAKIGNLILFVVDASGSMAARQRMRAVKGAIFSLLLDAYQKRDSVGLVSFRGNSASLMLPPTASVTLAQQHLAQLPTGGRTPLAAGLRSAHRTLHQAMRHSQQHAPLMVVVSDGRANTGNPGQSPLEEAWQAADQIAARKWSSLVIDCESGYPQLGMAARLGDRLKAETIKLDALSADTLSRAIRGRLNS